MITIKIESDEELDINITSAQWRRWRQGEYIQKAMPNLSNDKREFLISGVGPKEWEELFGKEE